MDVLTHANDLNNGLPINNSYSASNVFKIFLEGEGTSLRKY